jgi:hypothetical protein
LDLRKGDIVVMDNLSNHNGTMTCQRIKAVGASLLYLPPYSPDFKFGNEDALDIGLEGVAMDWAVEYEGGDHAARGQAGDESGCFPVAVRDADTQAFAAAAAAVGASHVGRSPGLVDEDQAFGIKIELAFEPGLAPLQDVGALLLGRVRRLFLRVMAWRTKSGGSCRSH